MRRFPIVASIGLLFLLAACSTDIPSKAGGAMPSVTLRAVAGTAPGFPSGDQLADFAGRVEELSSGSLTVELLPAVDGTTERAVAGMIRDAQADLGVIPVRAIESLGVTTTQALAAPFLIDRDAVADAVLADPLAVEMMAGFGQVGLTGLALSFDSLRQPLGTPNPLRGPGDFAGAVIAVPPGDVQRAATYEALGATTTQAVDAELTIGIHEGRIQGRDGSMQVVPAATGGPITGNVALGFKALAVVVNARVFDGLSASQQDVLARAALATRDAAIARHPSLANSARDYCAAGHGDVVLANDTQLRALKAATVPLYRALEKNNFNRHVIERIGELERQQPAQPPVSACTSSGGSGSPSGTPAGSRRDDQRAIDGIWRYEVRLDPEADRPNAARQASLNNGTWTLQFNNGHRLAIENSGNSHYGTYVLKGDHIRIVDDDGVTAEYIWHRQGDTMAWKPAPGEWDTVDAELEAAVLADPMRRIGDPTIEPGTGTP